MIKESAEISNSIQADNGLDYSLEDYEIYEPINSTIPITPLEYGQTAKQTVDETSKICLKVAIIDNPTYNRVSPLGSNPLDTSGVLNQNNGLVCLRYEGAFGGEINVGESFNGGGGSTDQAYHPDDRTLKANTDTQETVPLSYPFIWCNADNWCGINYLPPVGAKVVVGFGVNGRPMMLGFLTENYKIQNPPLKPGEIMIKGYGDNSIHWLQSNKLMLKAWCKSGAQDRDDSSGSKSADKDTMATITLDGDNGFIELAVNGTGLRIFEDYISLSVQGKTNVVLGTDNVTTVAPGSVNTNASGVNNNYGRGDGN